jgi:hypothetical protein
LTDLVISLSDDALEAVARRAAELVLEQARPVGGSPLMTCVEAAEYLRCARQRVDAFSRSES